MFLFTLMLQLIVEPFLLKDKGLSLKSSKHLLLVWINYSRYMLNIEVALCILQLFLFPTR